jgi:hypothetical protein
MKSAIKIFLSTMVFMVLVVANASAQRGSDYAYHNSNGANSQDTRYENTNGNNGRDTRYQTSNDADYNRDARYQNRNYYANCPELQRLYQVEDALRRRYEADLALGDRREARIDGEKLADVQAHILREESRYAYANPNYRRAYDEHHNDRNRRPDFDRDGGRRH